MGAVHWWDHSRVWLEEYNQSLKYLCQKHEYIPPAQQANKPTERILLWIKKSFLEQKPQ